MLHATGSLFTHGTRYSHACLDFVLDRPEWYAEAAHSNPHMYICLTDTERRQVSHVSHMSCHSQLHLVYRSMLYQKISKSRPSHQVKKPGSTLQHMSSSANNPCSPTPQNGTLGPRPTQPALKAAQHHGAGRLSYSMPMPIHASSCTTSAQGGATPKPHPSTQTGSSCAKSIDGDSPGTCSDKYTYRGRSYG